MPPSLSIFNEGGSYPAVQRPPPNNAGSNSGGGMLEALLPSDERRRLDAANAGSNRGAWHPFQRDVGIAERVMLNEGGNYPAIQRPPRTSAGSNSGGVMLEALLPPDERRRLDAFDTPFNERKVHPLQGAPPPVVLPAYEEFAAQEERRAAALREEAAAAAADVGPGEEPEKVGNRLS